MGRRISIGISLVLGLTGAGAMASDPPHSAINPNNQEIETTDSKWTGSNYDVRHSRSTPGGQVVVHDVSTNPHDDLGPRIAIGPSGDASIAWWRNAEVGQVFVRTRSYASGTWGAERLVSLAVEDSRGPEIAHDGTNAWVAYEAKLPGLSEIKVGRIIDAPDPISPTSLSSTSSGVDVDVLIHFEEGHLWVTWLDDAETVAWSEYDYAAGMWDLANFEPLAGDPVDQTRARIRSTVLGQ